MRGCEVNEGQDAIRMAINTPKHTYLKRSSEHKIRNKITDRTALVTRLTLVSTKKAFTQMALARLR